MARSPCHSDPYWPGLDHSNRLQYLIQFGYLITRMRRASPVWLLVCCSHNPIFLWMHTKSILPLLREFLSTVYILNGRSVSNWWLLFVTLQPSRQQTPADILVAVSYPYDWDLSGSPSELTRYHGLKSIKNAILMAWSGMRFWMSCISTETLFLRYAHVCLC